MLCPNFKYYTQFIVVICHCEFAIQWQTSTSSAQENVTKHLMWIQVKCPHWCITLLSGWGFPWDYFHAFICMLNSVRSQRVYLNIRQRHSSVRDINWGDLIIRAWVLETSWLQQLIFLYVAWRIWLEMEFVTHPQTYG